MPLSLIVTTTGRSTLARTLSSLQRQNWREGDEIVLVHDGPLEVGWKSEWHRAKVPGRIIVLEHGPHNDWGGTARNRGIEEVRGTHFMFLDDDDCWAPGARDLVEGELIRTPDAIMLFQMRQPDRRVLWKRHELCMGNISTPMVLCPTGIKRPRWQGHYTADFTWIADLVEFNPDRLRWVPHVIAHVRHE